MAKGQDDQSGRVGDGDEGRQQHSAQSQEIHDHLKEIERRLDLIIGIVRNSRLAPHQQDHFVGVFQGVRMILLAECEQDDPGDDYYPEIS